MVQIQADVEIDAPRETVWKRLADLGSIQGWAAPVAESQCDDEPGLGAVRRCRFADGGEIEETITDWAEGEGLAYEIASENPAFDGAKATWRVDDTGEGTRVTYEMDIKPPEEVADEAQQELSQTAEFLVQALKTNVETGEVLQPPE